jgi:hypothetical protein
VTAQRLGDDLNPVIAGTAMIIEKNHGSGHGSEPRTRIVGGRVQ